jgi:hypothetical protein
VALGDGGEFGRLREGRRDVAADDLLPQAEREDDLRHAADERHDAARVGDGHLGAARVGDRDGQDRLTRARERNDRDVTFGLDIPGTGIGGAAGRCEHTEGGGDGKGAVQATTHHCVPVLVRRRHTTRLAASTSTAPSAGHRGEAPSAVARVASGWP